MNRIAIAMSGLIVGLLVNASSWAAEESEAPEAAIHPKLENRFYMNVGDY